MKSIYAPQPEQGWRVSEAGNYVLHHSGITFTVYFQEGAYKISYKHEAQLNYSNTKSKTAPEAKARVERFLRERHGVTEPIPQGVPINFPGVRWGKQERLNREHWGPVSAHGIIDGDMGDLGRLRFLYATTGLKGDGSSRLAIEFGMERSPMIEFRHVTHSKVFFVLGGDIQLRTFADALEKLAAAVRRAVNG